METPTLHMHTIKVAILDPGAGEPASSLNIDFVREQIGRRLHRLPPLRRRIVEVPFGLHHPVWIEDPHFDIGYHVRRAVVPSPGGAAELDAVVADIASRPLDRRRPLWEMHVCEGLAGGKVGVVVKIHHAVADGVAAAALLANVMASDPAEEQGVDGGRGAAGAWQPEPVPGRRELVREALLDQMRQLVMLPILLLRTAANLVALFRHKRRADVTTPRPVLDAPRTCFNHALTEHRAFASTSLSLAEVKRIKTVFGVTVNDVILAATGGALRAYLAQRGELPAKSLIAGVPISADKPGDEPRLAGNKVSNLFTSLGTDEPDPARRVEKIHEVTREAKLMQELIGVETMQEWVQYTPPRPYAWVVRLWSRHRVAERLPPPINAVVSSVAGPRQTLYVGGAQLEHLYSVGPVLEGIGLNVTMWSYLDRLDVGVIACRHALPDVDRVAALLHDALAELSAAADERERASQIRGRTALRCNPVTAPEGV